MQTGTAVWEFVRAFFLPILAKKRPCSYHGSLYTFSWSNHQVCHGGVQPHVGIRQKYFSCLLAVTRKSCTKINIFATQKVVLNIPAREKVNLN